MGRAECHKKMSSTKFCSNRVRLSVQLGFLSLMTRIFRVEEYIFARHLLRMIRKIFSPLILYVLQAFLNNRMIMLVNDVNKLSTYLDYVVIISTNTFQLINNALSFSSSSVNRMESSQIKFSFSNFRNHELY